MPLPPPLAKHVPTPFSKWKAQPDPQTPGHWQVVSERHNTLLVYGLTQKDADFIVKKHNTNQP